MQARSVALDPTSSSRLSSHLPVSSAPTEMGMLQRAQTFDERESETAACYQEKPAPMHSRRKSTDKRKTQHSKKEGNKHKQKLSAVAADFRTGSSQK